MTRKRVQPTGGEPSSKKDVAKPKRKGSVAPRSFRGRIVAGVLIIIPLAVTAILVRWIYEGALAVGVRLANLVQLVFFRMRDEVPGDPFIDPADPNWNGVIGAVGLTILMLYLLGWLGTNVVGRRMIDILEGLVERIPFVDIVYPAIKRMVQALSGGAKDGEERQHVVLIDFPHENMNAIAFMTNQITDRTSGRRLATVYVPTTPNPTSGYMLIVPIERITKTDWTMEEALSMILSGGATARPEVCLTSPEVAAREVQATQAKKPIAPGGGGARQA